MLPDMARTTRPTLHHRFVVERYAPDLDLEDVRSKEPAAREAGRPIRYLGSIVIAAEETVFSVFEADDADVVAEVNGRAGLPFDRVVPIVELREPDVPALRRLDRLRLRPQETHR
jgi:hypothetical protein